MTKKINAAAIFILVGFLAYATLWAELNYAALYVYALLSLMAYVLYWKDKRAAINNQWRIPENTLHMCAVLGGWPGAMLAQQSFRHKTQKIRFRIVFWFTVVINLMLLVTLATPELWALLAFNV
ncbi:DUF1294 domain-containing protein [Marinagarivorans algicola]|uniref:DUF1294 domain-containing protein n=1 Tax=Marinagarivorans algicola TaxID=1513270 RepID=UPI0009E90A96|nr:DUF1294 domain-containing protein [Marinagarivorans algicola]